MSTTTHDLMHDLDHEWVELIGTRGFADELAGFIRRHPRLESLARGPSSARFAPAEADEILLALLNDHLGGSYPAGRAVLQCMVPAVRAIVRRSRRHYPELGDLQAETAGAMWAAITTYDLRQNTRVAMRLHGRTLTAVAGDQAPHARGRRPSRSLVVAEIPTDHDVLSSVALEDDDWSPRFSLMSTRLGATGEVLDLIAWGVDAQVVGPEDGALLARLYAPDPDRPEYDELRHGRGAYQKRVADELGMSHANLRQRASRAVRRLAAAVRDAG